MKLYDFPLSPNSTKVRALAYELGIELERVPVNLLKGESRTENFLRINPNGRVPVLQDGDFVLWESSAIMRYLLATHGGATTFSALSVKQQADVDRWLAWHIAHLSPAIRKVSFERVVKRITGQGAPDEAMIALGTKEFEEFTAVFERSLEGREYVAGPLSLADFALAPHYRIATTAGLKLEPYPNVNGWLKRMLSRESLKRAVADANAMMQM